jgi:hypothetical protein
MQASINFLEREREIVLREARVLQSQSVLHELLAKAWDRKPLRTEARRCITCRVAMNNVNLGGWSGRGPLSGALYCHVCADRGGQLLLALGDMP